MKIDSFSEPTRVATPRASKPKPRAFDTELHAATHPRAAAQAQPADDHAGDDVSPDDPTNVATAVSAIAVALGLVRPAAGPVVHATAAAPKPAAAGDGAAATPAVAITALDDEPEALPPPPMTPLEQAVHELLAQIDEHADAHTPAADEPTLPAPLAAAPADVREAPREHAPVIAPAMKIEAPQAITPQSHVHLVLDDGPDRVVVTVAVRGSDVHVALRANDDLVSANLARNAAVLDHAMRARGLVLAELATDTPPDRGRRDREPPPEPQRNTEPFELEETP